MSPSLAPGSEPNMESARKKQYRMRPSGEIQELSRGWSQGHPPCALCPISPEGAIPTGQQVVEDIERGLTGWASSHTQLLQKHCLWHSVEGIGKGGQVSGQASPTPHQGELGPWGQAAACYFPGAQPEARSPQGKPTEEPDDREKDTEGSCCPA